MNLQVEQLRKARCRPLFFFFTFVGFLFLHYLVAPSGGQLGTKLLGLQSNSQLFRSMELKREQVCTKILELNLLICPLILMVYCQPIVVTVPELLFLSETCGVM